MRIRTDGDDEHRADVIEHAASAWDCNKTEAVLRSCELATFVLGDLEEILADPRLPPEVAAEIVTRLDAKHHLDGEYSGPQVSITCEESA